VVRHDQLTNAALPGLVRCIWGTARACHQRGTIVYGERTTPNSARFKQRNRPSRAHTKKWRSIGCYSPA